MAKTRPTPMKPALAHVAIQPKVGRSSFQDVIQAHYRTYQRFDPTEVLLTLLQYKGINATMHSFRDLEGFFKRPEAEDYESYDFAIVNAIRSGDIEALRKLRSEGKSMSCCNRVGETILHLACRRGQTHIVRYLVEEVGVCVRVCDDYGRTPMHDACWTAKPNTEIVDLLLSHCPDLLFIKDMRGHTPLNYSPKEHWKAWVKYFAKNIGGIKPQILC